MVWSTLVAAQGSGSAGKKHARVDIVLDNAGFELVTDLVLADFLVSAGLAKQIRFHGKSFPWFVSDVTKQDFEWTIMQTMAANHKWMSASGVQWKHFMKDGTWSYHDHPFWTMPHEFCDMALDAADLYSTLQGSDLILFKGDLNYRKLTGDRKWEHTVLFDRALRGSSLPLSVVLGHWRLMFRWAYSRARQRSSTLRIRTGWLMPNMLWFSFPVHTENGRGVFKGKRVLTDEGINRKQVKCTN